MRLVIALLLALVLSLTPANAQFVPNGIPTITLDTTDMFGSLMNIAWSPTFNQYYGAGGGNPDFTGRVWSSTGSVLQSLTPINEDYRSLYYNPNANRLEMATYGANGGGSPNPDQGILQPLLDGSGLYLGTYTILLPSAPGLASDQTVPAYDAARNLLYSFDQDFSSNTVNRVNRTTGNLAGTTTLDLAAAGNPALANYSIGYDPLTDSLISFTTDGGDRALAFNSQTGAFKASINLPGFSSAESFYSISFTNNQMFVWDAADGLYRGFEITSIPEPATIALIGLAVSLTGYTAWRRKRKLLLDSEIALELTA